jgi:hypothetical protein
MDMKTEKQVLEAERRELMRQLKKIGPPIGDTVVVVQRRCGKTSCACHGDGPRHPALYVTWKEEGKTRALYVPRAMEAEVAHWADNHKELRALVRRITEVQKRILRLRET